MLWEKRQAKATVKKKGRRREQKGEGEFRVLLQNLRPGILRAMEPFRFDELWILRELKSCAPATKGECLPPRCLDNETKTGNHSIADSLRGPMKI